jgi:hypothetical protein
MNLLKIYMGDKVSQIVGKCNIVSMLSYFIIGVRNGLSRNLSQPLRCLGWW